MGGGGWEELPLQKNSMRKGATQCNRLTLEERRDVHQLPQKQMPDILDIALNTFGASEFFEVGEESQC